MTNPSARPGEFGLIGRYFAPLTRSLSGAANLTDDTASVTLSAGNEAVVTMDTMVAGVHFLPDDPPDLVARKLLRVNLSDLASAGARPLTYFVAMSLPAETPEEWVASFAKGLEEDQNTFRIALSGGDTTVTPGPITLSLTAIGETAVGENIRRFTAGADQDIYVSGAIGDAALALHLIQTLGVADTQLKAPALLERYRCPEPRIGLGLELRGVATAMVDVSDGLVADLGHICDASGVAAELEFSLLPLSPDAKQLIGADPALAEQAVTGGDDYELLFTISPDEAPTLSRIGADLNLRLTRIGRTRTGSGVVIRSADGAEMSFARDGWQHF